MNCWWWTWKTDYQGAVMERLGERRGELQNMVQLDGKGRVRLDYKSSPRSGLIGFQSEFQHPHLRHRAVCFTYSDHYGLTMQGRRHQQAGINGVLVSMGNRQRPWPMRLYNLQGPRPNDHRTGRGGL